MVVLMRTAFATRQKGEPMNDLISRQAAIDRINKQREHLQPDIYPQDKIGDAAYRICAEFIERLPSAQPEIIHCRDCKHWQSEEYIGNNNVHTLNIASLPCKNWLTGGDWYCGSAERKDI